MSERHLSPELLSLAHHVALNESGWWKKAVQRLIIAALWSASRPLTCAEIANILASDFSVSIDRAVIDAQIKALKKEKILVDGVKEQVYVSQSYLRDFETEIENAKKEGEEAEKVFLALISLHCVDFDSGTIWEEFNSNFLLPMIRSIGANTYRLVTGEQKIQESPYLEKFLTRFDESRIDCVRRTLSDFFSPKNSSTRSYILNNLNVYFLLEAANIPKEVLSSIEDSQKKRPQLKLLLDTNFLFSVLGLHENPSDMAAETILNLQESLRGKIDLRLYVIQDTIDEAKRVISAVADSLRAIAVPSNVASAALHTNISGIMARYFEVAKDSESRIKPQDYFAPYLDNFIQVLRSKGIELYNVKTEPYHIRQDVVDDLLNQQEHEKELEVARRKSYEALSHDMTLWHVVNDSRPTSFESPLEAGNWIITLDYRFLGFDGFKQHSTGRKIPICLHPTALIQLLQFWVPMSEEVQENILNSIRLPLIFHEFNKLDELVTLKIVQTISRYEDVDDLPEETIQNILVDKALRARLSEDVPEQEQIEIIREELIKQHSQAMEDLEEAKDQVQALQGSEQALESQLTAKDQTIQVLEKESEEQKGQIEELDTALSRERSETENLNTRLTTLEGEISAKNKFNHFRNRWIYIPLVILVISLAVVYFLISGDITSKLEVLGVWLFIFCLAWVAVLRGIGRRNNVVSESSSFKKLERLGRKINFFLGALLVTILGTIITSHWQDISNWLHDVWNSF